MAKLFSKEKDIFLKVINSILVLWLMVAIVIALGVGINIINKGSMPTYDEYKNKVCELDKIPQEEIDKETTEANCHASFVVDKSDYEDQNKANTNNILIAISNIVIVSLFLHLLNRKAK